MMSRTEVAALLGTKPIAAEHAAHWHPMNEAEITEAIDRTLHFQELVAGGGRLLSDYQHMFDVWLGAVERGMTPRR